MCHSILRRSPVEMKNIVRYFEPRAETHALQQIPSTRSRNLQPWALVLSPLTCLTLESSARSKELTQGSTK